MSAQFPPEVLRRNQQPLAPDHSTGRAILLALCILLAYALAAAAASPQIVIEEPGVGTYWRFGELARISWRHNLGPDARFIVVLSDDGGETFLGNPPRDRDLHAHHRHP